MNINRKKAYLCVALTGTLLMSIGVVIAAQPSFPPTFAMANKESVGTSTEYSASLVMRATYNNEEKYFSYNDSAHIADVSGTPVEYTLSWVNGDSDNFSIYDGTHYLDISTSANKFTESETPVYWSMSEQGICRTSGETTKYLYYNNSSPRVAPYGDKSSDSGYAMAYFYTDDQLDAWKSHCTGSFAEQCLTKIAYDAPTITVYTISFNANGGSGSMADVVKSEGSSYSLPANGFTAPSGKTFDGWATSASGEKITTNSITINADITLYALWKDEITGLTSPATVVPSDLNTVTNAEWEQTLPPITFSSDQGTITSEQIRVFSGKTLTISTSSGSIKSIVFTCTANGTTKYGPGCFTTTSGYTYSGKTGTWTGSAASVTFTASSNQVRITQIVITFN